MDKLDKIGVGNAKPLPQNTKLLVADDYNKVVEKVNEVIDDLVEFASQSTTAYTITSEDVNKYIQLSHADAITLTVPNNSSDEIAIGSVVTVEQSGAGAITATADVGVTLHGNVLSAGQYTILVLIKTSINTWTCVGGTV